MALFIFIIFHLLLEVKSQGLPQARLTIFPTFATDKEKVQMICGGHEDQHMSECMFYPVGLENSSQPSTSCNISLTAADLISWSQDQESSHVNISCYYTVYSFGKNGTSPHSDRVSVRVRGLGTMSSLPPVTEDSLTTKTQNGTFEGMSYTTGMSSLSSHDSQSFTDAANASLESTTITDTAEQTSVLPLMTKGPEIKKYSNTKLFFFIAVVASGGGIVLTGLMGICLYGCTRKSKAERIWIEFSNKKQGLSSPTTSSEAPGEEDAVLYSTINFMQPPSQLPGNSEESMQTEVEQNHLYYTILTNPVISGDSRSVYSELKVRPSKK